MTSEMSMVSNSPRSKAATRLSFFSLDALVYINRRETLDLDVVIAKTAKITPNFVALDPDGASFPPFASLVADVAIPDGAEIRRKYFAFHRGGAVVPVKQQLVAGVAIPVSDCGRVSPPIAPFHLVDREARPAQNEVVEFSVILAHGNRRNLKRYRLSDLDL